MVVVNGVTLTHSRTSPLLTAEALGFVGELERRFADERVAYIHLHNARPGCFSCLVRRC